MAEERLNEIRKLRLEKANKLREIGVDPYASKPKKKPGSIENARRSKGKSVAVAGRVMGWRAHGNVIFADLKDESGEIQLFFQKKKLQDNFKILKYIDIGDFIFTEGKVFNTTAGEISVDVHDFQILTKAIRPMPSTWHGLKDVEERYRKRYLDILLNKDVKDRLSVRSKVIQSIRNVLESRGFTEVETPTLQPVYGGGFARPFVTHHNALNSDYYLRISDEMYLKRLIVGGFEKVFEITKVFRNEGVDHDHNPEFTMFEAMIAYEDYYYGMDLIEEIIEKTARDVLGKTELEYQGEKVNFKKPWKRMRLAAAVEKYAGVDPLSWKDVDDAKGAVKKMKIDKSKLGELAKMKTLGQVIAFVFEEMVEKKLISPTIIYDYPIEVSPLAKKTRDPRFTARFEMFALGMELGNNYSELTDAADLQERFIEEKKRIKAGFAEAHQTDEDYVEAIEYGLPPTCGIAIGIDRLVMLLTNAASIREVIAFPTLRPLTKKTK
jgi:lysyl-tRNA synthetase class 2